MQVKLVFSCNGDAFGTYMTERLAEARNVMRAATKKTRNFDGNFPFQEAVMDSNGNTVGYLEITND